MTGWEFEDRVRTVARSLWHLSPGQGAAEFIGAEEIDCVCRTEDLVHLVECTQLRTMEKYRLQVNKLVTAKRELERQRQTVKLWVVTEHEPTPDQRRAALTDNITALSLQEFSKRLLDSRSYLEARSNCAFGSAVDPETGQTNLPDNEYIALPITTNEGAESFSIQDLCAMLTNGESIMLQGPFGAGKSLTVREIFRELKDQHYKNPAAPVPMAINLREHWGQSDVDELIRRHAARVGFERSHELVRAWNAGGIIALLDGVDELASPAFPTDREGIRSSRQRALRVVKEFVSQSKGRCGILLAGRDHYFDSIEEAKRILSLPSDMRYSHIGEFSEEQAAQYLTNKGISHHLPNWLPRKPLLLGYLAAQGLLNDVLAIESEGGTAYAWDQFIDRICEREAELDVEIDKDVVRQLLEALATRSRQLSNGTGPLYESDLAEVFRSVTGIEPMESAKALLQRLPGLTSRDQEIGARSFIDLEMLQALRAGDVARFMENPYRKINQGSWYHALDEFGCSVAGLLVQRKGVQQQNHRVAAMEAINRWQEPTLALDCLLSYKKEEESLILDAGGMAIVGGNCDTIDLVEGNIQAVILDSCLIEHIRFDVNLPTDVVFRKCMIDRVEGVAASRELPAMFDNCEIVEFDNTQTNTAIMRSSLPSSVRVLLTIIRKLFLQKGSGRVEAALYRGLEERYTKHVEPILQHLDSSGIIFSHPSPRGIIWHGNRAERTRMLRILEKPTTSDDVLLASVARL